MAPRRAGGRGRPAPTAGTDAAGAACRRRAGPAGRCTRFSRWSRLIRALRFCRRRADARGRDRLVRHGAAAATYAVEPADGGLTIVTATEILLALLSGGLIGIVLGLVGGGGSILAVPLLVYVVGVSSTHAAIGTAAVAVAANAATSLAGHARASMVKWPCAIVFAAAGMIGAAIGAEIGKAVDGSRLLMLFGLLMIGVGLSMLRKRRREDDPNVRLSRPTAPVLLTRLVPMGLGVGLARSEARRVGTEGVCRGSSLWWRSQLKKTNLNK